MMIIRWFSSSSVVVMHFYLFFFFKSLYLIKTQWRAARAGQYALLSATPPHAKRGLSGIIFDSRPAYPWRRGAEFELVVGSVGVLSTRAGGGGGCRYSEEDTQYVCGRDYRSCTQQPASLGAGGSEHYAGLLCSIHTTSKDI